MDLLKSKKGGTNPIWGIISIIIGVIVILAFLRVLGINVPFAEFIKKGITTLRKIFETLNSAL